MVALQRLGVSTALMTGLGDDLEGEEIRRELQHEGVDIRESVTTPRAISRLVAVFVQHSTGERCFAYRPDTCPPFGWTLTKRNLITNSAALLIDEASDASITAAQLARSSHIPVIYDGGWYNAKVPDLLCYVDIAIVSDEFVREWKPQIPQRQVLDEMSQLGATISVVTRGSQGCLVKCERGIFAFPAYQVQVRDTTGAGDAFHAGFIFGLLQRWPIYDIVRFASAVAAINCSAVGGTTGLPTLAMVYKFLSSVAYPSEVTTFLQGRVEIDCS
jgi:ribokinase